MDDLTAIGLLVTAFNNPKITDHPLPESVQLQAVDVFKAQCAQRGVVPTKGALAVYCLQAWAQVSEMDKLRWMARLVDFTRGKVAGNG